MRLLSRLLHRRRTEPSVDEGLQAERTAMAWQRTALGLGGLSALLLHLADRRPLAAIPGMLGLVVAIVLLALSDRRYVRVVSRVAAGESTLGQGAVLMVTAVVVLLAVSAVALIVVMGV
jgi:uncharacterized membrane protein YidH (DUF202 family)